MSRGLERLALAAGVLLMAAGVAQAKNVRVALVPGGPHPYFADWEQAVPRTPRSDFGSAPPTIGCRPNGSSGCRTALESLLARATTPSWSSPATRSAPTAPMQDLTDAGIPSIATAGCTKEPTHGAVLLRHRYRQLRLSRHQGPDQGDGRQGPHRRTSPASSSIPNTQLRMKRSRRRSRKPTARSKLVQMIADIDAAAGRPKRRSTRYLAAHGQRDRRHHHHRLAAARRRPRRAARIGDKRIKMVGIDHDRCAERGQGRLRAGTMLQNPYGQAYIGSYAMEGSSATAAR